MKQSAPVRGSISIERGFFAAILGALLPLVFPIFGSAPLLALRHMGGRLLFVLLGTISVLLLAVMSYLGMSGVWLPFLAVFVLVGLYSEFEFLEYSPLTAGVLATGGTFGLSFFAFGFWLKSKGLELGVWLESFGAQMLAQIKVFNPETTITSEQLIQLAPSTMLILAGLCLWFGLLFESRFRLWFGQKIVVRKSLSQFAVPEWVIFVGMAAAAAAFIQHDITVLSIVGLNLFNVLILLYFFQGLAVTATYFQATQMSQVWQMVLYFILIGHMFLVVAALGVADYWLNLREKILKKMKSSIQQRGNL